MHWRRLTRMSRQGKGPLYRFTQGLPLDDSPCRSRHDRSAAGLSLARKWRYQSWSFVSSESKFRVFCVKCQWYAHRQTTRASVYRRRWPPTSPRCPRRSASRMNTITKGVTRIRARTQRRLFFGQTGCIALCRLRSRGSLSYRLAWWPAIRLSACRYTMLSYCVQVLSRRIRAIARYRPA